LCSYRPLDEAIRRAIIHISANPDFRINVYQMTPVGRINFTVGAEIPKKYL